MRILEDPSRLVPLTVTVLAVALGLYVARKLLDRGEAYEREKRSRSQMLMLGLSAAGRLAVLFALPLEEALLRAAEQAELSRPFVLVLELGDFSVTCRVGGLLSEVEDLNSKRSRLRASMLDALHAAGIEIVSPTFMNTRALDPARAAHLEQPIA